MSNGSQPGMLEYASNFGRSCSMIHWITLLVGQYRLPLKMNQPGVIIVLRDLDGLSAIMVCSPNDAPLISIVKD